VYPGDLVLNNQQAWRGSVGVSKYHGIISPAYIVMDLSDSFDSRFADYLFQSRIMVSQFVTSSKGVGDIQRDIHIPWLKDARVPIPPLEEQQAISVKLDKEITYIARELSLYERDIILLREYRARLIADVVTGKIDVRMAAARLPDEDEEPQPIGEVETMTVNEEGTSDDLDGVPEEAET
jgi:type I restriction enzyme S subunit